MRAAIELIADEGYGSLSMRALARASGIKLGAQIEAIGLPAVFVFEGGYAVSALGENVAALLKGFRRP